MNTLSRLLPLCTLGLGLGLGLAWFHSASRPSAEPAPAGPLASPSPSTSSLAPSSSAPVASPADFPRGDRDSATRDDPDADPAPGLSDETRERLFAAIEAAYTTYDAAALPRLTPHLRHPDPEVRAFAREAIVQLGHADGVAALRSAARDARDPREATELLDAADFLELPPAPPISASAFPPVAGQATAATRRGPAPAASPSF